MGAATPWDALADAHERHADAVRAAELATDDIDRARAALEADAAAEELDRAQALMGLLGGMLLCAALDHGTNMPRARLAKIVGELTDPAHDAAVKAVRLAKRAWNELDALKARVRELEDQIARLTPGVGHPSHLRAV